MLRVYSSYRNRGLALILLTSVILYSFLLISHSSPPKIHHSEEYDMHVLHRPEQHNISFPLQVFKKSSKRYEPRIFCWVMTSPKSMEKALAVKNTWLKRCNGYIFVSSENSPGLPAISANVPEGRNHLWGKTKFAFKYAYQYGLEHYDWFLKADDDTYVIVENLRLMLSNYSSKTPLYFGNQFKLYAKQGYMSGGAGYVLSREALKRLVEDGLNKKNVCRSDDDGAEDAEMGKCLERVNVTGGDSRDQFGRGRFFAFQPAFHLFAGQLRKTNDTFWYFKYLKYPENQLDCCSDTAISFHYISVKDMYMLDYLLYTLRPHPFKDD